MTDNEIIKWLEEVSKKYPNGFQAEVLTLINRQKAEVERLQKEANLVSILFQDLQERTKDIKAEAYKEFAERLKKEVLSDRGYDILQSGTIDKVLNEMEGEKNDK